MKFLAPALYIAGAAPVWLDFSFMRINSSGMASFGLVIYTLPIFIVGNFLLQGKFPYVRGRYSFALYFWPSVALLALALFFLFHALQKIARPIVPADVQKSPRR